jgi:hypothetical protein
MIVVMKTVLQFTGTGVRSGSFSFNIWRRETGKNGARGDEIKMTADLVRRIISFRRAGGSRRRVDKEENEFVPFKN